MKRAARIAAFIGALLAWLAVAVIVAWLFGRMLTDRYAWSQWLWWIPTPALLPVVLLGLIASLRPAKKPHLRRNRLIRWGGCGLALLIYFSIFEHRLLHGMPAVLRSNSLKIAHWNVEPAHRPDLPQRINHVIQFDADITILTNPGRLHYHEQTVAWMGDDRKAITTGLFAVITKLPVMTIRPVIFVDEILVTVIEFDASQTLQRPLVMYLIDLPSDPKLHRLAIAQRVRAMLDEHNLPPPDIAVGDFNIPRGSASLSIVFPGLKNAFDSAGHGYGATYFRPWPLYHLDHMLLGDNLTARRYDIIDPGVSRHRTQITWLVPKQR